MLPAAITTVFRNNSLAAKIFFPISGHETKNQLFHFLVDSSLPVSFASGSLPFPGGKAGIRSREDRDHRDTFQMALGRVP